MAGYQIGMDNLYIAKMLTHTKTGSTYATPVELAKAISGTLTPAVANANFYAGDKLAASVSEVTGAEITLTVDDLTTESLQLLFGLTKNADGVLEYTDVANDDEFALIWRSKLHNGGYRHLVLLRTKPQLNADSYSTKGESVEMNGREITFTAMVREDGKWRYQVDSNDTGVKPEVIDEWFTAVYDGPTA